MEVRQTRMGANADVTRFAGQDGGGHNEGIAGVKTTGNVSDVDEGEKFLVGTLEMLVSVAAIGDRLERGSDAFEIAITFTEVDVDESFVLDGRHGGNLLSRSL